MSSSPPFPAPPAMPASPAGLAPPTEGIPMVAQAVLHVHGLRFADSHKAQLSLNLTLVWSLIEKDASPSGRRVCVPLESRGSFWTVLNFLLQESAA